MRLYSGYLKQGAICSALLGITVFINGCSFSESSESLSDSTSSIISSPSSLSGKNKKFQNEIADYTVAYIKSSQSSVGYDTFFKGISEIAAKEGITNWEQDSSTYKGIGKGLKKAEVEGVAYETYKKNFTEGDADKMSDVQSGYDAEK